MSQLFYTETKVQLYFQVCQEGRRVRTADVPRNSADNYWCTLQNHRLLTVSINDHVVVSNV